MNKLHEAGEKIRAKIEELSDFEGKIRWADLALIEEYSREVCVEYARSVVPGDAIFPADMAGTCRGEGYASCKSKILSRIDQDLLSLNK